MHILKSRRLRLFIGWLLVGGVIFLSLIPGTPHPARVINDKLGHIIAYCLLMAWFAVIYSKKHIRAVFAFGFISMGAALEFIQPIVGGRTFEFADMLANGMGIAIGWIFAVAVSKPSPPI